MWALATRKHMNCLMSAAIVLGLGSGLWLPAAHADHCMTLDPGNPGNFNREGQQTAIPGDVLRLIDTSSADRIVFYASDACADRGRDCDVVATFQVMNFATNNVDAGNRVVINDGISRAAIATCVVINSVRGIGLQSQGQPSDATSYPVFVPVDWQASPVTVRLRRYANGDAELIEINGVAPNPPALLPADQVANKTRAGGTTEFGVGRPAEPECTVDYAAFWSEPTATSAIDLGQGAGGTTLLPPSPNPSPGPIQLSFRLQDPASVQFEIFDVSGHSVARPPMQIRPAGTWSMLWNGRHVPAGVYWVRMSLESKEVGRQRFILLP